MNILQVRFVNEILVHSSKKVCCNGFLTDLCTSEDVWGSLIWPRPDEMRRKGGINENQAEKLRKKKWLAFIAQIKSH